MDNQDKINKIKNLLNNLDKPTNLADINSIKTQINILLDSMIIHETSNNQFIKSLPQLDYVDNLQLSSLASLAS